MRKNKRPELQIPDANLMPEVRRAPSPKKVQAFGGLCSSLPRPYYRTAGGRAYLGDALALVKKLPDASVDLILTSPPFALARPKAYGNEDSRTYQRWFLPFAAEFHRVLKPTGSLVLELGGTWEPGRPVRSLYQFELLLELSRTFRLAQEFYHFNNAKLPTPAEWVAVRRIRLKDAVTMIWWLAKTDSPKASNRRVLYPYGTRMEQLLRNGYNAGARPSQHQISEKWGRRNGGAIAPNIIVCPNTVSTDPYLVRCRQYGLRPHPARFVPQVPRFFARFLTSPGDIVLDPFGGSNMTGREAETNGRFWLSFERDPYFLYASSLRFFERPRGRLPLPQRPPVTQKRFASSRPSRF